MFVPPLPPNSFNTNQQNNNESEQKMFTHTQFQLKRTEMNVCSLCSFEPCSHTFLISHLFLFNQILTIISCSSIIHHKTKTSKHSKNVDCVLFMINSVSFNHWIWTYIHPENNNVDEFVLIHGIVFFVTWNVKHTNLLMFIINLLHLTQQTKLSQYISIPVQVKQELISIRKQLNQRTQRYSSSIKHESRIYLQIVQLLFSTKSFHNSLKSLTRIISLWDLYMDLGMMSLFILLFSWSVHTETVCVLWNHNSEVSWFSKQPQITPNRKSCCELHLVIITIIQITCHKQTKRGDWLFYHHSNTKQTTTNQIPF